MIVLPLRLVSESNMRGHWSKRARRAKEQRSLTFMALRARVRGIVPPIHVTIRRIGARKLDTDNLQGACKAVRDGIADAFGVTDADERIISFVYEQRLGEYGVEIEIR